MFPLGDVSCQTSVKEGHFSSVPGPFLNFLFLWFSIYSVLWIRSTNPARPCGFQQATHQLSQRLWLSQPGTSSGPRNQKVMITLHGMAENRFTSVYFLPMYFLVNFFYPLNFLYSFFQGCWIHAVYDRKLAYLLIQMHICLMIKRKKEDSHIYGLALHSQLQFFETLCRGMAWLPF